MHHHKHNVSTITSNIITMEVQNKLGIYQQFVTLNFLNDKTHQQAIYFTH